MLQEADVAYFKKYHNITLEGSRTSTKNLRIIMQYKPMYLF